MSELDQGLTTWQRASNHNRMIELQKNPPDIAASGSVELALTLLPATDYVSVHDHIEVGGPTYKLDRETIAGWSGKVLHFGDHVAFDKPARVKGQDWG